MATAVFFICVAALCLTICVSLPTTQELEQGGTACLEHECLGENTRCGAVLHKGNITFVCFGPRDIRRRALKAQRRKCQKHDAHVVLKYVGRKLTRRGWYRRPYDVFFTDGQCPEETPQFSFEFHKFRNRRKRNSQRGICCVHVDPDECKAPMYPGPCNETILKFYYDAGRDDCFPFTYGGCNGNGNNFESHDECAKCIKDKCQLPQYPGPCNNTLTRYYYDSENDMCSPFTYGGCHGNENNFELTENCTQACVKDRPGHCPNLDDTDVCTLTCINDRTCPFGQKCCETACGGTICMDPMPSCEEECTEEEVCVLREITDCDEPPCPPVTQCVLKGNKEGQCPTPGPDSENMCTEQCTLDHMCEGDDKCCPTSCGATTCTPAEPPNSCDYMTCNNSDICREVYENQNVTPECFAGQPTEAPVAECTKGFPLLLKSGGEVTVADCGDGADAVNCPEGYDCVSSASDSVCCQNTTVPICYPSCPEGQICYTGQLACDSVHCPPVPICVFPA
ncbi:uncharacterized protein LOC143282711 [Babylonia areolata]|uniref:uncharacterized protein LOC143282711 n=1 Tax=Babylonia areolata TaxID=304850 RepID=UPI003FD4D8B6